MLVIDNLSVRIQDKEILKKFSLTVQKGEIHAIMGPNGAGKSTLAKVIMGHPEVEVIEGSLFFDDVDLLELDPEERARRGLFMSFQYPMEIKGVTNFTFLLRAYESSRQEKVNPELFREKLKTLFAQMDIPLNFLDRDLNDGFSGGEKKRSEILQMLVLDPRCIILDETDSGLDIDALKLVAKSVSTFITKEKSALVITHYQRLLDYLKPDFVHVMKEGRIVKSGGKELALELEARGYQSC